VKEMESYFSSAGVPIPTRVFDLGMMNYQLVGGRVHQLVSRRSALFVYRGPGNRILLCQMYPGESGELPGGAEMRENNGIRFHVYRKDGLTLVFWQEGTVMCVLASDAPGEEVIQLAFAKAVRI
jgi:anti-sigma factor RsiW